VALVGFGLDSLIEVTSGGALLWRLHHGESSGNSENAERTALRIVGFSGVALAMYVGYDCAETLLAHEAPGRAHYINDPESAGASRSGTAIRSCRVTCR
jgi:hypothetical protein